MYNVFTDSTISYNNPSVLILAHKQDLPMAKGISLIQSNLEKELYVLFINFMCTIFTVLPCRIYFLNTVFSLQEFTS